MSTAWLSLPRQSLSGQPDENLLPRMSMFVSRVGRQLSKILRNYRAASLAHVTPTAEVRRDVAAHRTHVTRPHSQGRRQVHAARAAKAVSHRGFGGEATEQRDTKCMDRKCPQV